MRRPSDTLEDRLSPVVSFVLVLLTLLAAIASCDVTEYERSRYIG